MSIVTGNVIVAIIAILIFVGIPLVVLKYQNNDLQARIEELEKQ